MHHSSFLTSSSVNSKANPVAVIPLWKFRAETPPSIWNSKQHYSHAFRIPIRETPFSLRIPRCCLWYGMDNFWNHPILSPGVAFKIPGRNSRCNMSIKVDHQKRSQSTTINFYRLLKLSTCYILKLLNLCQACSKLRRRINSRALKTPYL